MLKYPHLFTPKQIGGLTFKNRILASATGHVDLLREGTLSDCAIAYYERKATGGAAAVVVGECQTDMAHGARFGSSVLIDLSNFGNGRYLSKLADGIVRHGSIASAELQHTGIFGGGTSGEPWGPSACVQGGVPVLEMNEDMITEVIENFGKAAAMAKMNGFQMVTVHGGHGWLIQQFFSPFTNHRTDRWGGSAENRARLAVAVCDSIHRHCGSRFPVEMRISAIEFDQGYDIAEGVKLASALDGHADIIHCSVGIHGDLTDDRWLRFAPTMYQEPGINVKYAAEIKKHVKTPVACIGGLTDPQRMEDIIASGKADFVAIGRGLICDPDLPNKARAGRDLDIRHCIRCFGCFANLMPSMKIFCTLNPETSRELEFARTPAVSYKKKVLVAGGGIAGMEAAITAAKRGHSVILCEKTSRLGGVILCEENVPFKSELSAYIARQIRMLTLAGVDVRLDTEVNEKVAEAIAPDVIIAALGSAPARPNISGLHRALDAEDAFRHPDKTFGKVAVLGAGLVGSELAIYLKKLGRDVIAVEMGSAQAAGTGTQSTIVKAQCRDLGIPVELNTKVVSVGSDSIVCEKDGVSVEYPADTVICALGRSPMGEAAAALAPCAGEFHMIGDCSAPANIMRAVKVARTIALDIGTLA